MVKKIKMWLKWDEQLKKYQYEGYFAIVVHDLTSEYHEAVKFTLNTLRALFLGERTINKAIEAELMPTSATAGPKHTA